MAYPPKINEALKVLQAAGISRWRAAPLSYRLLWSLGIPIRPPQFHTILGRLVVPLAAYVIAVVGTRFLIERPEAIDGDFLIMCAASVGGFSLVFIPYTLLKERKDLPDWSELDDVADRFD